MAKLKIYTFPDPVLSKLAKPIPRVEKAYRKVADDMLETMYSAPGVGLAANQVGILERILVLDTDYDSKAQEREIVNQKPLILINPEITYKEGEILFEEGCLSVPEYSAEVKRAEKIKIKYTDIDGLEKTLSAEGLQAVCIQHEIDHLNGKLFIERLSAAKKDIAVKKLIRERKERDNEQEEEQ